MKFEKSSSDTESGFENSPSLLSSTEKTRRPSFGPSAGSRAFSSRRNVESRVVEFDMETKSLSAHPRRRLSAGKMLERTLLRHLGMTSFDSDRNMPVKSFFSDNDRTATSSSTSRPSRRDDNEKVEEDRVEISDIDRKIKDFIRVRRQLRTPPRPRISNEQKKIDGSSSSSSSNGVDLEWRMSRVKRAVANARAY